MSSMAPTRFAKEMAELTQNFMESASVESQKQLLGGISDAISKRKSAGVLDLVEVLGEHLTNGEVQKRRKATRLLAELMHRSVSHLLQIAYTYDRI